MNYFFVQMGSILTLFTLSVMEYIWFGQAGKKPGVCFWSPGIDDGPKPKLLSLSLSLSLGQLISSWNPKLWSELPLFWQGESCEGESPLEPWFGKLDLLIFGAQSGGYLILWGMDHLP